MKERHRIAFERMKQLHEKAKSCGCRFRQSDICRLINILLPFTSLTSLFEDIYTFDVRVIEGELVYHNYIEEIAVKESPLLKLIKKDDSWNGGNVFTPFKVNK